MPVRRPSICWNVKLDNILSLFKYILDRKKYVTIPLTALKPIAIIAIAKKISTMVVTARWILAIIAPIRKMPAESNTFSNRGVKDMNGLVSRPREQLKKLLTSSQQLIKLLPRQ